MPQDTTKPQSPAGELPHQTYTRLTGKKWGTPQQMAGVLKQHGITAPPGSAEANLQLQAKMLGNQPPQPPAPTDPTKISPPAPSGIPAQQPTPEQSTQPTTGTPEFVEQGVDKIHQETLSAYDNLSSTLNQIRSGNVPLNSVEQSYVDGMNQSLTRAKEQQDVANKNYEAATKMADIRGGLARYSPQLAAQNLAAAVNAGNARILDLDLKANQKINEFKMSIQDNNLKSANDAYDRFVTLQNDRIKEIQDNYDRVNKHENEIRDYNLKVQEFKAKTENEKAKLELETKKTNVDIQKAYAEIAKVQKQTETLGALGRTGKPPTAEQSKAAGFGSRMQQAAAIFDKLAPEINSMSLSKYYIQKTLPSYLQTPIVQQQMQAERNFVNAVLRRESGAAISPTEFDSAAKQYFPQPGDAPEVLSQKKANRELATANLIKEAGTAYDPSILQQYVDTQENDPTNILDGIISGSTQDYTSTLDSIMNQ